MENFFKILIAIGVFVAIWREIFLSMNEVQRLYDGVDRTDFSKPDPQARRLLKASLISLLFVMAIFLALFYLKRTKMNELDVLFYGMVGFGLVIAAIALHCRKSIQNNFDAYKKEVVDWHNSNTK